MERTKRILGGVGKVALAIVGGILFPVLIWVALGVAIYQRAQERGTQRKPTPTIGEILHKMGGA